MKQNSPWGEVGIHHATPKNQLQFYDQCPVQGHRLVEHNPIDM